MMETQQAVVDGAAGGSVAVNRDPSKVQIIQLGAATLCHQCRIISNANDRCPFCFSQIELISGALESEATALAHEIATEMAKATIDGATLAVFEGTTRWFDLDPAARSEEHPVFRSVRYLDLRGVLITHQQRPSLVRWED